MSDGATWGVVTTAREAPDLTVFFAAYHLAAGAMSVTVHLDDPDDPVFDALEKIEGCFPVRCDKAYWKTVRRGWSEDHRTRQVRNATRCFHAAQCDWLFHLDVDEFLYQFSPVSEELAGFPEDSKVLKLPVLERVMLDGASDPTVFGGVFKRELKTRRGRTDRQNTGQAGASPLGNTPSSQFGRIGRWYRRIVLFVLKRRLYGRLYNLTRNGFLGHVAGKAATRVGPRHTIGLHRPQGLSDQQRRYPITRESDSSVILHFDGMTQLHWIYKRLRAAERKRQGPEVRYNMRMHTQILEMEGDNMVDKGKSLFDRLGRLDPRSEALLRKHGYLYEVEFELEAALKLSGPLDLSPDTLDRWVAQQYGPVLERYGWRP